MTSTQHPVVGIALIGAGMVGHAHANGFRSISSLYAPPPAEVRLVAVVDANETLARDLAARYGFARVETDWRAVAAAQDVDAVVVALPNHEHQPVVEGLLAAGKHVLCEKPLAPTAATAYALLAAAQRAGVVHMTGFTLRHAPGVAAIHRAIQRGDFGAPRQFIGRYLTDYARSPEVPFTWRYTRALAGGGALHDIGAHVIDLARWLFGEIDRVDGAALTIVIPRRPVPAGHVTGHATVATTGEMATVDTDDIAAFTLTFANGATGEFSVNRTATGFRNSAGFLAIGADSAASFDTERFAEFGYFDGRADDDLAGFRRVVTSPRHPHLAEALVLPVGGVGHGYAEAFVAQSHAFVRAIVDGDFDVAPSFEDGYRNALVCGAVQRAAESGCAVSIREIAAGVEGTL